MESYFDVFARKVIRKANPMCYLYSCWRKNYNDKILDGFIQNNFTTEDGDFRSIKNIMRRYWIWRGVHYSDFHEMSLDKKSERERKMFVPRWEEVDLYFQVNDQRYIDILINKWNCYNILKEFYKRPVVLVSKKDIRDNNINSGVMAFMKTHDKFIIKPLNFYGKGFRIVDIGRESVNAETLLLEYLKRPEYSDGFLLEEMIVQDCRLADFHPESVNKIRITTVNYGNAIETKWPVLQMGRGDSAVVNAASRGIIAAIDEKTGTILRAADKQRGSSYTIHPDTRKPLIGFQIPLWNELCETLKSMASKCPDCPIMGWDMALTDQGWVVSDCTYGPELVIQWALGHGVRDEFEEIRNRLHAKKGNSYLHKRLEPYLSVPTDSE